MDYFKEKFLLQVKERIDLMTQKVVRLPKGISLDKLRIEGDEIDRFFYYRSNSKAHGDYAAIQQVLIEREYDISQHSQASSLKKYIDSKLKRGLIIDAGANIGAASIFFHLTFKNVCVFAIEPDTFNFELLESNTINIWNQINFQGALSSTDGYLYLIDPLTGNMDFRTQNEKSTNSIKVKSICIPTILQLLSSIDITPFILKIDIEGAEDELFSKNIDWIAQFPLIIIELHAWMLPFSGSNFNFVKAISNYDFDILIRGENLFLYNRNLLQ